MGLGELGSAAARTLVAHGFQVLGWSRSPKALDGVVSYAGRSELHTFLHRTDILVCLLPLTADTIGILNAATFTELPHGAFVINVARGQHLVEDDLVQALDSGHLGGATLDVFHEEPLPPDSPLWTNPKVLVTPHAASYSVPATAADGVAANIRRVLAGEPLLHQVDRARGY
jgi:glyoxylate/hydroxypyruvate reductase A